MPSRDFFHRHFSSVESLVPRRSLDPLAFRQRRLVVPARQRLGIEYILLDRVRQFLESLERHFRSEVSHHAKYYNRIVKVTKLRFARGGRMTIGMMRRRDEMGLDRPLVVAVGRIVPYRYRRYEDLAEFTRFGAVVVVSVSIVSRRRRQGYVASTTLKVNRQFLVMLSIPPNARFRSFDYIFS